MLLSSPVHEHLRWLEEKRHGLLALLRHRHEQQLRHPGQHTIWSERQQKRPDRISPTQRRMRNLLRGHRRAIISVGAGRSRKGRAEFEFCRKLADGFAWWKPDYSEPPVARVLERAKSIFEAHAEVLQSYNRVSLRKFAKRNESQLAAGVVIDTGKRKHRGNYSTNPPLRRSKRYQLWVKSTPCIAGLWAGLHEAVPTIHDLLWPSPAQFLTLARLTPSEFRQVATWLEQFKLREQFEDRHQRRFLQVVACGFPKAFVTVWQGGVPQPYFKVKIAIVFHKRLAYRGSAVLRADTQEKAEKCAERLLFTYGGERRHIIQQMVRWSGKQPPLPLELYGVEELQIIRRRLS